MNTAVTAWLTARRPGTPHWEAPGTGVGGRHWRIHLGDAVFFCKTGDTELLAAETDGLAALAGGSALRVPQVLTEGEGFILMEWLPLMRGSAPAAARLGEALARQHAQVQPRFGWRRHNFIGATPQFNREGGDWTAFFREQRLGFQLRLAAEGGHSGHLQEQGAELLASLPAFFAGHTPHPALLHGDLWGGNWGMLQDGGPVVFDPAVHCGDRECDLAMTELFGGFPPEFHAAYRLHAPLDPGYALRRDLYQLYHVLNHLNLFGAGYLGQALSLMQRLLSALR